MLCYTAAKQWRNDTATRAFRGRGRGRDVFDGRGTSATCYLLCESNVRDEARLVACMFAIEAELSDERGVGSSRGRLVLPAACAGPRTRRANWSSMQLARLSQMRCNYHSAMACAVNLGLLDGHLLTGPARRVSGYLVAYPPSRGSRLASRIRLIMYSRVRYTDRGQLSYHAE